MADTTFFKDLIAISAGDAAVTEQRFSEFADFAKFAVLDWSELSAARAKELTSSASLAPDEGGTGLASAVTTIPTLFSTRVSLLNFFRS